MTGVNSNENINFITIHMLNKAKLVYKLNKICRKIPKIIDQRVNYKFNYL